MIVCLYFCYPIQRVAKPEGLTRVETLLKLKKAVNSKLWVCSHPWISIEFLLVCLICGEFLIKQFNPESFWILIPRLFTSRIWRILVLNSTCVWARVTYKRTKLTIVVQIFLSVATWCWVFKLWWWKISTVILFLYLTAST